MSLIQKIKANGVPYADILNFGLNHDGTFCTPIQVLINIAPAIMGKGMSTKGLYYNMNSIKYELW